MGLDAALDQFWEVAEARGLGIDAVQVVAGDASHGERRRIDDIRRDVFSVSKTVTSLAVGMLEGDGLLSLDDPVLAHLPELADTAAPGSAAKMKILREGKPQDIAVAIGKRPKPQRPAKTQEEDDDEEQ